MSERPYVSDFTDRARDILPGHVWDYLMGGAGEESRDRDSRNGFRLPAHVAPLNIDAAPADKGA